MRRPTRGTAALHVLLTTDAVGGVFSYNITLARELLARGMAVTIVLQGPSPDQAKRAALEALSGALIIETDWALEWQDPAGREKSRTHGALAYIVREQAPDIVHLCNHRDAFASFDRPVVVTSHSCVRSWWSACRGDDPNSCWTSYIHDVADGLNAAAAWIAPTHSHCSLVSRLYAPRTAGHVVLNGAAPPNFDGVADRSGILSAGRLWDEAKAIQTLLAAADDLHAPVAIAGASITDSPNASVANNTCWLGELSHADLSRKMRRAAVFVSPAIYEPFGLSVLEAAGWGCALVLADIETARELWDGAALFFAPGDARNLQHQANRLCDDAALLGVMRGRAVARAARYTAHRFVDGTLAVYEVALSKRAHGRPLQRAAL